VTISTARLETFSDSVISILITLMVFDIKVPGFGRVLEHREVLGAMSIIAPKFIAYLFSFIVMGIMWVNHHHTVHLIQKVDSKLLWLNLHQLFWMSMIPFPTSMVGSNPLLPESAAIFGAVLTMNAVASLLMRRYAIRSGLMRHRRKIVNRHVFTLNKKAMTKGVIGVLANMASIPLAYVSVYLAFACVLIPIVLFFIPDNIPEDGLDDGAGPAANV
jgi:uncharacterized membrane protein